MIQGCLNVQTSAFSFGRKITLVTEDKCMRDNQAVKARHCIVTLDEQTHDSCETLRHQSGRSNQMFFSVGSFGSSYVLSRKGNNKIQNDNV